MSTTPTDLYSISMDDLRKLAETAILETPAEPAAEQPRDEQGRFTAIEEGTPTVDETTEAQTEVEPVVVEKEIDLADGSGVQVFRGVGANKEEAYAALADELATAQANATKKIRELAAKPAPAPVVETPTPENEFLLQQQLLDSPRATIRNIFKEEFGMTPAEIKTKLAQADQIAKAQEQDRVAVQFMAATPEYNPIPQNAKRLVRQLEIEGLPETVENLQKVYNDLKADGLITPKAVEGTPTVRPRASGLSTRTSAVPPPPKAEDLSKLSLDELRERAGGYIYRQ